MNANEASKVVVDSAIKVHSALGPGLLESIYEACLAHELGKRGIEVKRQLVLPIWYDGRIVEAGLRIDLLVEQCLVLELKAIESLLPIHTAQLLTYLKLAACRAFPLACYSTSTSPA